MSHKRFEEGGERDVSCFEMEKIKKWGERIQLEYKDGDEHSLSVLHVLL